MKYTQKNKKSEEIAVIHNPDNSIFLRVFSKDEVYEFDKEKLEEFIGVLLHIQSRVRKGGKNA